MISVDVKESSSTYSSIENVRWRCINSMYDGSCACELKGISGAGFIT